MIEYKADKYYNDLKGKKVICIDFDNTICLDEWPYIGPIIPGAVEVLTQLRKAGHKLILYTQRSSNYPVCCKELYDYYNREGSFGVDLLTPALKVCNDHGIGFDDINKNLHWEETTNDYSRKIFMDYLIDDHVMGTKRIEVTNKFGEVCKIVDWFEIDRWCLQEGLYKDTAFKCGYHDYLKEIKKIDHD